MSRRLFQTIFLTYVYIYSFIYTCLFAYTHICNVFNIDVCIYKDIINLRALISQLAFLLIILCEDFLRTLLESLQSYHSGIIAKHCFNPSSKRRGRVHSLQDSHTDFKNSCYQKWKKDTFQ